MMLLNIEDFNNICFMRFSCRICEPVSVSMQSASGMYGCCDVLDFKKMCCVDVAFFCNHGQKRATSQQAVSSQSKHAGIRAKLMYVCFH